jgi:ABC-type sugar transport system ATPase subunit
MSTLRLKNISKAFGVNTILDSLSLNFESGTVTALVGDNGAGKSTLLKSIAGSYSINSGEILLDEKHIHTLTAHQRREHGIEMVYQDLALAKQHDVISNLFLGRELESKGFLRRCAMKILAKEKLGELGITIDDLSAAVETLSGGQQQAIAIARAALFNPHLILFDEPTAALAAREVNSVLALIKEQKARGRIVILVSHRLNDVFEVADRVVVLKRGKVVADTPAAETSVSDTVQKIVA